MSYDNRGRFGLWRNKDRKENTHPHLTGSGEELSGSGCWISAWFSKDLPDDDKKVLADMIKRYEGISKRPFLNISVKLKESRAQEAQAAIHGQPPADNMDDSFDDDIPF